MLCLKMAGWVANSVDPDEMPLFHLGHAVCSGLSVWIHKVNIVPYCAFGITWKDIFLHVLADLGFSVHLS